MKSLEAIKMSKLINKKPRQVGSYTVDNDGKDFEGAGDVDFPPLPTAKTGSSMDVLKAHRATSAKVPSAMMGDLPVQKSYDIQDNPVMKSTEIQDNPVMKAKPYSPIKNYLKRGR